MSCTIKDIVIGNMEVRHNRQTKQYIGLIGGLCLKSVKENPVAFRQTLHFISSQGQQRRKQVSLFSIKADYRNV